MNNTVERFLRYIQCSSESTFERDFCLLIEHDLKNMGIYFERQFLGSEVSTNGWNILAKVEGINTKLKPYLFVFHLDTVSPGTQIKPIIENGIIKSEGKTVLGADGKLAIALVLEAIEKLKKENKIERPIELLFTVCQERGLLGAKNANYSIILSEEAIVIDHFKTGEYLTKTPSVIDLNVEIVGKSAHVMNCDSACINSLKAGAEILHRMEIGRISDNLVINVSDFVALAGINVIPKYTRFDVEARSFDESLLHNCIKEIRTIIEEVSNETGCEYSFKEHLAINTTNFETNTELIEKIKKIGTKSGIEMKGNMSFGYLDATCTNNFGIKTIALGININDTHSVRENVVVEDIKKMEELINNIILDF